MTGSKGLNATLYITPTATNSNQNIEMRVCQTSATIANWWIKMRDSIISAKWRSEISEQQKGLPLDR